MVLEQLSTLDSPEAMTRVFVRKADRADRREAESILRREADEFVWSLTIPNERSVLDPIQDPIEATEDFPNLRELFREFVNGRKGTHYNETFATEFLERGDRALEEAMLVQDAVTPEEDARS
jgi:hypothetical protein